MAVLGMSALALAPPRVAVERRPDGAILLRSPLSPEPCVRSTGLWLRHWAATAPERLFLAERAERGWRRVSYGEAYAAARAIGQALIDRGLSADRPVVILSDNSLAHALLGLGAAHVGIPFAPISPAYSLMSADHGKLKRIFALLDPGLVFVDDGARYGAALAALEGRFEVVADRNLPAGATAFDSLTATAPTAAVDQALAAVGPDSIAKFLFTSGSTGEPKAVINTHRMLSSNQQAIRQLWRFLETEPPVLLDWLPWNHTFGANHNFNLVLSNGGSLYIDDGKPAPGLFERTVANLRDVRPNLYFNVPRGFEALAGVLEADAALADHFFSELKIIFYAGAALPQNIWARFEKLGTGRRPVMMASAWGSTETAPLVTSVHFPIERAGVIGLPAPGIDLLMVPSGGKLELRVRGPNVFPGYWRRPDLTAEAFDQEGFYRIGDAGRFADPEHPEKGIEFDGRIAEDFKLSSGTWVHVGQLRLRGIAALAPLAQDIVVTGHDRDGAGFLVLPAVAACRALCPDLGPDAPLAAVLADARVRAAVSAGLQALKAEGRGSSTYAARAILMAEPPGIDQGEITDKGYINQRAVLTRRADLVDRIYRDPPDAGVIAL